LARKKAPAAAPPEEDTDERVKRSKELVLRTVFQLMSELGLGGVSVDAVSKQSGVAKTTIYRHWPTRSALILAACSNMSVRPQAPDTGTLKGDLTPLLTHVANQLRTAKWPTAAPSIIDAAERDPQLAEQQARFHQEMRGAFRTVIERAQQRGEIPRNEDPADIVASILGPLFYRRWFSREPLDDRFVRSVLARVVGR
jgi:AcrR family transcriptional regulator